MARTTKPRGAAATDTRTRGKKGKIPIALAKRAAELVRAKKARLLAEANELVDLVRRRKQQVSELFYDMGEALRRLRDPELLGALGYRSFARLCDEKLKISAGLARRLIAVVTRIARRDALAMGQSRAFALVDLAEATPEDDTPAGLLRGGPVALPGGGTVDPRRASGREIERGAKAIREAHQAGKPRRGRTTTPAERALASALEAELRRRGVEGARVTAVGTNPGAAAGMRIERVPSDRLGVLARAIAAVAKRT